MARLLIGSSTIKRNICYAFCSRAGVIIWNVSCRVGELVIYAFVTVSLTLSLLSDGGAATAAAALLIFPDSVPILFRS